MQGEGVKFALLAGRLAAAALAGIVGVRRNEARARLVVRPLGLRVLERHARGGGYALVGAAALAMVPVDLEAVELHEELVDEVFK